jgi:formamidase
MDGQVHRSSDSASLEGLNLDANHPLTGPIEIRGARPGDILEVETLAIDCDGFGATYVIPGFGLLGDLFDEAELIRWDIENGVARSPDLPGVTIRGEPYLGTVGVAPSWELLERASAREAELLERGGTVLPPQPAAAVPTTEPFASRALRTIPPRENGGNLDIRQAGIGSRLLLPVHVDGALLSVGDIHFAQGDGESCGTAIEVAGVARLRVALRPASEQSWRPRFPVVQFTTPPDPPGGRRCIATTGIPLSDTGELGDMDLTLAARRALLELLEHLVAIRGYSRAQAYALASVAADLRVSEAVNVPSPIVSAILPLDVFDDA